MRGCLVAEADRQLVPHALVGPVLDPLAQRDVDVIAAARFAAHAGEREAAGVGGVDQLVVARRDIGEDAEPAERVLARELLPDARREPAAAGPARAVAADDEAAVDALLRAAPGV